MEFTEASRLVGQHDVVLVGYRGIDGSSVLNCPEVTSALANSTDLLSAATIRAEAAAYTACAQRMERPAAVPALRAVPEYLA